MVKLFLRSVLSILLTFTVLAVPFQSAGSASTGAPELFLEMTSPAASLPASLNALRSRTAGLNRAVLAQVRADGAALSLSLFPNARHTAVFTQRHVSVTGGYTLSGSLLDVPGSEVVFSFQDDSFYASINTRSALYQVQSISNGQVLIEQLDPALPGAELEPITMPAEPLPAEATVASDDDGTRLDVLVVYTSAVANAVGESTLLGRINTAVTESNLGYANSQVTQRVNLAGTLKVTWTESGFDWSSTLNNLTNGIAPFNTVPATRDALRADLVALVVLNSANCGIGWLLTSPTTSTGSYAFSVVSNTCLTGYYSFAHEQGHNEGAHHDRWTVTTYKEGTGAYTYSYGYWMWSSVYNRYTHRTIMAYDCLAYQGSSCTRVNYWSNPNVSYLGMPTGVASNLSNAADNRLTLNNTAPYVARFRDGLPPIAPTNLTATDLSLTSFLLKWVDANNDESGFKVYRAAYNTTNWVQINTLPSGTTSYTDAGLVSGVNYSYKVVAYSGNGTSSEVTVNAVHILPAAPTTLVATTASMIRINLTWLDNSTNETGFEVERSPNGSTSWVKIATVGSNIATYSDASLPCITPTPPLYYYRVRAINGLGVSTYTPTNSATTSVCTAPPPPSPATYSATISSITLLWTNIDGETQYVLERETTPTVWSALATVGVDVSSYTVSGLNKGTTYKFRVKSINSLGSSAYIEIMGTTKGFGIYLPAINK